MVATFVAALRAVGTATTMAAAGFYLHRRGLMTSPGQKMMALISQQVTIPAFLFARIIYCPKGSSSSSNGGAAAEGVCPSVADRLSDLWMLLLWPIYVVVCGLITGYIAARISRTPTVQIRSCLAACAFPNSTGMVITLLTVIHDQFSSSTELGRIDPTAFLSVYMLMYPVLQWGVGGWLLASDGDDHGAKTKDFEETTTKEIVNNIHGIVTEASPLLIPQSQPQDAFSFVQQPSSQTGCDENGNNCIATATRRSIKHILNMEPRQLSPSRIAGQEEFGDVIGTAHHRHHHIRFNKPMKHEESHHWISTGYIDTSSSSALNMMVRELSFSSSSRHDSDEIQAPPNLKKIRSQNQNGSSGYLLPHPESELENHHHHHQQHDGPIEIDACLEVAGTPSREQIRTMQGADILPLTETLLRIASKVFQPPVIASLLGLFIASVPELRGLFENIWGNKGSEAPFKFAFDGIYAVG
jgi:predicted permease